MSKRYRNSFKRILCHCGNLSRRSYSNRFYNRQSPHLTPSPYTRNPYHRAVSSNRSLNQYDDHLFTFTMSKYKFVIGSRRFGRENSMRNNYSLPRRTSFHYHWTFLEKQQREDDKQKIKSQIQQTKFTFNGIQQQNKQRTKFIFTSNFLPSTPPNSSINDSKSITQLPTKH